MALIDSAQVFYNFLKDGAEAAAIRATLTGGSVYYTGDVATDVLSSLETTRGNSALALCLAVHDGGESPLERGIFRQRVGLYIYDRRRGYHNIRATRDAVLNLLPPTTDRTLEFTSGQKQGLLYIKYEGRQGHRLDSRYQVEFDVLYYASWVEYDID